MPGFLGGFSEGFASSYNSKSSDKKGMLGKFLFGEDEEIPKSKIQPIGELNDKVTTDSKATPEQMQSSLLPLETSIGESLAAKFPTAWKTIQALKVIESSGNYGAVGPAVKGKHAYGAYQVMEQNIGPWSKEALGREVPLDEFRKNKAIQDRIAVYKINALLEQGHSPQDAASIWFSGRPLKNNGRKDLATGISVPSYVANFNKAFYA